MTLVRDSSHVVRRVVPLPEPSKMKRYWILLLPVLLVLFQVIAVGLRPLGIRPTLSAALLTAVVADLLTVGIAFFLVARSPGNRLARLGLEVPRRKRDLLFLPIVGGILTFVGLALADAVYALLTGGQLPPPQAVTQALAESEDPGLRILAVLAVGLVAPFAEEIVFRGVSFRGLRRSLGFLPAAALSAGLFSLAHLDLPHALQLFTVGIVLAWTAERSGSILPGMLLHAGVNLASLLLIWESPLRS